MADTAALQVPQIARRPLHEEAADRLRELIVHGQLGAGTRLNERLLCVQFGVSRTPLREAIKLLAAEGLVELLPNRGAIVAKIDAVRVAETLAIMGALEALAGELACSNADDAQLAGNPRPAPRNACNACSAATSRGISFNQAIHLKLVKSSGNNALPDLPPAECKRSRARYMANLTRQRWDEAIREHEEILAALGARRRTSEGVARRSPCAQTHECDRSNCCISGCSMNMTA